MGKMRLERRTGFFLIAFALAGALLLATFPLPAAASATTLHVTSGTASITRDGIARAAAEGESLTSGDEVTTAADGYALLAFVDGSTLTLEPGTTVGIAEVTVRPGSTVTRLVQSVGRTWSSVQRLISARSRYEIRTPSLTATVRGTAFEVDVAVDGGTRVHTVEGAVGVSNALGEVIVVAGTQTTATPATPPASPAPPAPSTLRTLRIGDAPVVVVDEAGRSCGRTPNGTVQQIPGCIVSGGEIRILGSAADRPLRTIAASAAPEVPIVETVVAPGANTTVRAIEVGSAASAPDIVVVTQRPLPAATTEVTLPLIGVLPVQAVLTTPAAAPTAATAGGLVVPQLTLPPIPTLASATTAATPAPSIPSATASLPPVPTVIVAPTAVPTVIVTVPPTIPPTPLPTIAPPVIPSVEAAATAAPTAAPTPAPTPSPTAAPTPTPTPIIQLATPLISPAVLPTPTPTATPTATPSPTPSPTPVLPVQVPVPGVGVP